MERRPPLYAQPAWDLTDHFRCQFFTCQACGVVKVACVGSVWAGGGHLTSQGLTLNWAEARDRPGGCRSPHQRCQPLLNQPDSLSLLSSASVCTPAWVLFMSPRSWPPERPRHPLSCGGWGSVSTTVCVRLLPGRASSTGQQHSSQVHSTCRRCWPTLPASDLDSNLAAEYSQELALCEAN